MSTRILSSSLLVGQSLFQLGERFPELCIAPYRSIAWKAGLPSAEAMIVLLSEPLTQADLDLAPHLRVIGTYSVGMNHLPQEVCRERGIRIVNTPGVLTEATADLALTLLLAITRRVAEGEALVRSGTWKGWAPEQLLGMGLSGKTCGILGSGPIGRAFAKRVWALGMKPIFWDRDGRNYPVDFGAGIARRLPLKELLPLSSVLSLHCPLTHETRGILDRKMLGLLPTGAILINTARGGVLDESATLEKLHTGHLGGVGLDVYDGEPSVNPAWFTAPNAVLLPHLGSATRETREAMAQLLCDGLAEVLEGGSVAPE
jgi:glyoxylate reductase